MARRRSFAVLVLLMLAALLSTVLAGSAQAAVAVSRAEVSGSRLRIEGQASPNRAITVDGVNMATSSSSGRFRIDRSGYTPPADCNVDVNDGSAVPNNVVLSGCTPAPPPATASLSSVSLNPASLQGGATSSATVTLTANAPSGGAVVALSSSNTAVATVAASVTVPAGVGSASAVVSTTAVSTTATSVISATYNGVTRNVTMTVTPPAPPPPTASLDSIILDPATVQTGTTQSSATIWFTSLTPSGGAFVTLSSSNTSVATVPPSVTVPAQSSSGAFPVAIRSTAVGTTTISATYNGVTRSAVLTAQTQSLFRIVTSPPLPNATVGQNYAGFIEACCGQGTPYLWSLVSGTVPDGLRFAGNDLRLTQTTGVTGVATRVQTTTFTVRATDQAGNTDTRTFSLTVDAANPLVITNQSDQLPDGKVGVAYETGLFPGGGTPPYRWSHIGGTLPPGLAVQASPGRVLGTPTTAGNLTFTVRVDDSAGQFATRQFSILVVP